MTDARVRYIYIYIYRQTDRQSDRGRVELPRWGSLTLAPIIYIYFNYFFLKLNNYKCKRRKESAIIVECCQKLDQSVHNSRVDWLPANPECGVSLPQGNGQALEQVTDRFSWRYAQSLTLYMADAGNSVNRFPAPSVSAARGMKWTPYCVAGFRMGGHLPLFCNRPGVLATPVWVCCWRVEIIVTSIAAGWPLFQLGR